MGPVGDDVFPERVEKAEVSFGYEIRETGVCAGASPWAGEAISFGWTLEEGLPQTAKIFSASAGAILPRSTPNSVSSRIVSSRSGSRATIGFVVTSFSLGCRPTQ